MRGKVVKEVTGQTATRITPAYAGKSSSRGVRTCFEKDHPRVCGEKRSQSTSASRRAGSPPRMRGKARSACFHLRNLGITPAYAGKSGISPGFLLSYRDHPRVCGEKFLEVVQPIAEWGSPPRMRGKGPLHLLRCRVKGITPAYAGKRGTHSLSGPRRWDHPRVCGEKGMLRLKHSHKLGSPPRMRGKGH